MGMLAGRIDDISRIQKKLATANKSDDIRRGELDSLLNTRFDKVSDRLNGALDRLMEASDEVQSKTLKSAVDGVVKAVSDTHGIFEQGLKQITDEISGNKKAMLENNEQSQQQLIALGLQIDGLPEPEKVDLSALNKDIKAVGRAVESIPTAKFPDLSSQFKKIVQEMADLRERLDTREIVFDIERRDDLLVKRVTGRVIK